LIFLEFKRVHIRKDGTWSVAWVLEQYYCVVALRLIETIAFVSQKMKPNLPKTHKNRLNEVIGRGARDQQRRVVLCHVMCE